MQQSTHAELVASLEQSSAEIDVWLARAAAYIERSKITLKQEAAAAFDDYKMRMATERMEAAAREIIDNSVIMDGYRILNEIGESIRGEKITYSITITSTGHWGSADAPAGQVITWDMDYSVFSKMIKTGSKRLILADSATIMSQLSDIWSNQGEQATQSAIFGRKEWSTSEISQYESFHSWSKRYRKTKGKKIFYNRGQTLEGYFRWLQERKKGIKYTRDMAMLETARNNLPFYAGGDLGSVQIKGMNASVANIDTMISVLSDTQRQLHLIIAESAKMAGDVSKVDAKAINENVEAAIQSLLARYGFGQK